MGGGCVHTTRDRARWGSQENQDKAKRAGLGTDATGAGFIPPFNSQHVPKEYVVHVIMSATVTQKLRRKGGKQDSTPNTVHCGRKGQERTGQVRGRAEGNRWPQRLLYLGMINKETQHARGKNIRL